MSSSSKSSSRLVSKAAETAAMTLELDVSVLESCVGFSERVGWSEGSFRLELELSVTMEGRKSSLELVVRSVGSVWGKELIANRLSSPMRMLSWKKCQC